MRTIRNGRKALILAAALWVPLSGCQKDMQAAQAGDAAASRKVLVAGTASDFKAKVAEGVLQRLPAKDYSIRVVGLDSLEKEDLAGFGAVLLVNTCMGGRADGRVRRFLAAHPDDSRVIVFTTRGGEGKPIDLGAKDVRVDAVSAVSPSGPADVKAEEVAGLIRRRFEGR